MSLKVEMNYKFQIHHRNCNYKFNSLWHNFFAYNISKITFFKKR